VNGITADFRGASFYRVNITGDPILHQPNRIAHFFNLDNIRIPLDPSQPFGTAGRNAARSMGIWQFDTSLNKSFDVTEKVRMQFRAEVFNLLNRANFLAPASSCSGWTAQGVCPTAAFGQVGYGSTLDPRLIQLGLKLSF
jgi:hypothetical protein